MRKKCFVGNGRISPTLFRSNATSHIRATHIQDELIPEGRDPLDFTVCAPLWQRMTIRANGDVIACCHLSNKLGIGNINESSIYDIWHGERMNEIRRIHLAGRYQEIDVCKSCMS